MKIIFAFLFLLAVTAPLAIAPASAQTQPPQVLAELFDNFGCTNCPGNDDPYYSFVAANPSYGVVVISYHNQIGYLYDEFFVESSSDVNARDGSGYYNIIGDPAAFIDGYSAQNTYQQWELATTQALNPPYLISQLTQAPKAVIEPDGLIHIIFSATGPPAGKGAGLVRVALKESKVYCVNPESSGEGNPPGDLWDDIFRAMLPNSTGTTPLAEGETRTFDVPYDPNNFLSSGNWNTNNMTAVVFVQDVAEDGSSNYDVESIGVVSLANPAGVAPSPNPSTSSLRVIGTPSNSALRVSLPSPAQVRIVLSDMLGRDVHTISDVMMPAGETSVEMANGFLLPGCYIARLIVDGNEADHAKLIVE